MLLPIGDNMAQEPDRYQLPVSRAALPQFGPLTRSQVWEFPKNSPSPTPWRKSPKFGTLVGVGIPPREKILGPCPILEEL